MTTARSDQSLPGHSTRFALGAGFVAMLALMLFITVVGIGQMSGAQKRLDHITANHMEKIRLVTAMRNAARERTVNLQKMILLTDPFERDEQWLHFNEHAGEFARLRGLLRDLGLTPAEEEILSRQGKLTAVAVPLQEEVARRARAERNVEAHRLLVVEAIPAQDRVLAVLNELYELQERRAQEAVSQARDDYQRASAWMLFLYVVAFGLGVAVAVTVLQLVRRADLTLRREKERAQVTLHSLGEAVIRADIHSRIEYLNPVAERLTGWTDEEARGRPLPDILRLLHDTTRDPAPDPAVLAQEQGRVTTDAGDTLLIARDGTERAIELTAARMPDDAGSVLVFRDVTEMRALSRELAYQATHDPMTGLFNRREFERRLQRALDDTRIEGIEHALCYLDVDLFKTVNDTCGHLAGDELLKQLSLLLRSKVRKEDILARIGGDEFALLLQGCSLDKAGEIGESVRLAFRDFRFVWEDKSLEIGASVGVVPVTAASGDLNDVLRSADVACRVAKEEGRNRIHVFRPNDLTIARHHRDINWVQRLRHAVDHGEFELCGQWILPLGRHGANAPLCEILLQLRDGDDRVMPAVFLPAAERYHLMPTIDRWVIRNVFRLLRSVCPSTDVCFNINLSGQSLCDPEFLPFVQQELADSGVPPSCLGFEITETAAVTHMSRAVRLINTLREAGCRFSLDDFGSGLSSFNYLKNMPVDFLKIDGAFVRNCPDDATDLAMVTSINQVAHILGIRTVAEYVESQAISVAMTRVGIDYGQGIALAGLQPLQEIIEEVRRRVLAQAPKVG
jgi:diguanylate cyclase (GGDEF)-like protein/PAS domain S-box-containing protein